MIARTAWLGLAALVGVQIAYPLVTGADRALLVAITVVLGCALSVGHAAATRGGRVAAWLVAVTALGGFAVEVVGVATGIPFGRYGYQGGLGPAVAGVPLLVPLAWTWMAWPAWLAASALLPGGGAAALRAARVAVAGLALAAWDLYLDPQMVAAGYWRWADPQPGLPGVPGIPLSNYLGWLAVALAMMAAFAGLAGPATGRGPQDAPMLTLYLWTYASALLAHAVFLELPGSAWWGGAGMGLVTVPLAVRLLRSRRIESAPA